VWVSWAILLRFDFMSFFGRERCIRLKNALHRTGQCLPASNVLNFKFCASWGVVSLKKRALFQAASESLRKTYLTLEVSLASRSASHPGGVVILLVDSCFRTNFTVAEPLQ